MNDTPNLWSLDIFIGEIMNIHSRAFDLFREVCRMNSDFSKIIDENFAKGKIRFLMKMNGIK